MILVMRSYHADDEKLLAPDVLGGLLGPIKLNNTKVRECLDLYVGSSMEHSVF